MTILKQKFFHLTIIAALVLTVPLLLVNCNSKSKSVPVSNSTGTGTSTGTATGTGTGTGTGTSNDVVSISLSVNTGAPGTLVILTSTTPLVSTSSYQVKFGDTQAPVLGAGDSANQLRVMVPIHDTGSVTVQVNEAASGLSLGSAQFDVLALPQTGKAPGEVISSVVSEQKIALASLKNDALPLMITANMMNATNQTAATAEIDRAMSILSMVETDIASLPDEQKLIMDQLLHSAGILEKSGQALKIMQSITRGPISGDPYAYHHLAAAMDGFSSILSTTKELLGPIMVLAALVPGFQVLAPLGTAIISAMVIIDNLIDAFIPTDLSELSILLAEGQTEVRIPLNNIKKITIMGKFTPQSDPLNIVVDQLVDMVVGLVPGSNNWLVSTTLNGLVKYGLEAAQPLSGLSAAWTKIASVDYPVDPAYYQGGLNSFITNIIQQLNFNYMPDYVSRMGILDIDQKIKDPSIASFDPLTSSATGLLEGTTGLIFNGYAFKSSDANVANSCVNRERPQMLPITAIKGVPIIVTKEISVYPENGAIDVATSATIVITFAQDLDTTTKGTVTLGTTDYTVATFNFNKNALTVTPPTEFAPDTSYTGIFVKGFKTYDSTPVPDFTDTTYTFKTAALAHYSITYNWVTSDPVSGTDDCLFGSASGITDPAGYSDGSTYTQMLAYKDGPGSGPYTLLTFKGFTTGNYPTGSADMIRLESYSGYFSSQGGGWVTVNVTRMDGIDGVIEGTFGARLIWTTDPSVYMDITNGTFRVKRVATSVY